jgi:hypothetical protein
VSTAAVAPPQPDQQQNPLAIGDMMQHDDAPRRQKGQDPTPTIPTREPGRERRSGPADRDEKEKLLWLRREFKSSWAPQRRAKLKRVLKAFETLKNNVYSAFDPTGFEYNDPIGDAIAGNIDLQDAGSTASTTTSTRCSASRSSRRSRRR